MYTYTSHSHKGLNTEKMQDKIVCSSNNGEQFFGVFDGHDAIGDSKHIVDFISRYLMDIFWEERKEYGESEKFLYALFNQIQIRAIQEGLKGGTTASILFFDKEGAHWRANVGDSPIYGVEDTNIKDLVGSDYYHNVKNIFVNGEDKRLGRLYNSDEMKKIVKSHYLNNVNMTRTLGDTSKTLSGVCNIPLIKQIEPRYDRYIITSDGISDSFSIEQIMSIINKAPNFSLGIQGIIDSYEKEIINIFRTAEEGDLDSYYRDNASILGIEKQEKPIEKLFNSNLINVINSKNKEIEVSQIGNAILLKGKNGNLKDKSYLEGKYVVITIDNCVPILVWGDLDTFPRHHDIAKFYLGNLLGLEVRDLDLERPEDTNFVKEEGKYFSDILGGGYLKLYGQNSPKNFLYGYSQQFGGGAKLIAKSICKDSNITLKY